MSKLVFAIHILLEITLVLAVKGHAEEYNGTPPCGHPSSITNEFSVSFHKQIRPTVRIWRTIEDSAILSSSYFLPILDAPEEIGERNRCPAAKQKALVSLWLWIIKPC